MQKLKVIYTGRINRALDEAIREFFKKFEFIWIGQGVNFGDKEAKERDISFERKLEKEAK